MKRKIALPHQKNEPLTLSVTGMTQEGNGVARTADGFTVFIPLTAPGDVVETALTLVKPRFAYGRLLRILSPSPHRLEDVGCAVFTKCGGCSFRHLTYSEELLLKESFVRDSFCRIGGVTCMVSPIHPSPHLDHYRNKAQYPIQPDGQGGLQAGFYARRSHRVVSANECPLQPTVFGKVLRDVLSFCMDHGISAYDEKKQTGLLRHLYLREGASSKELMVTLVINGEQFPHSQELISLLRTQYPEICSILLNHNMRDTNVILGLKETVLFGFPWITDQMCGLSLQLSAPAFYQVNTPAAELLYQEAVKLAQLKGDELLLDLYCGVGSIGLFMAAFVKEVIGVEIVPQAIENARENARISGISNASFLCADAGKAAKKLADQGKRPDIAVIDPPRKGCSPEVIAALIQLSPQKIVMISCNPATAARDVSLLGKAGYSVSSITPFDLFPRTTHVETLVLMTKKEK